MGDQPILPKCKDNVEPTRFPVNAENTAKRRLALALVPLKLANPSASVLFALSCVDLKIVVRI